MTESLNRYDRAADWSDVSSGEAIGPVIMLSRRFGTSAEF
jgi:hypothetical protein